MLSPQDLPDNANDIKDALGEAGISNRHIYLPITHKKESIGVLIIFPTKSYHYDDDDLDFFKMISEELGITIKQAIKYEKLRSATGEAAHKRGAKRKDAVMKLM